jgi:hypothetical protein
MELNSLSLSDKFSVLDLAIKALALCPQAMDNIQGGTELADYVVKFAKQIAARIENPS